MRQAHEKRCLAPTGMMEAFHGEEFAVDGVVRLIQHGAHRRPLWGCEIRIPSVLLALEPSAHALALRFALRRSDAIGKVAQALAHCHCPQACTLSASVEQRVEL